ncbi:MULTISPECIES: MerR family transcriptional regulator [Rhodococcus]|uniref:Putative MerR family transcriptional regulator n=2 Tax=Rhodococcus opacus TaxID=37919 RepID=C1BDA4_RHOOB|nr:MULTISPECIES: MerR family transcriptional regulator [Rhodococcus]EID80016.1 putative MerR family transcriptional regulator [Rhodococcus opacus RKJ300 = JCM 13270]KAF0957490.1 hypothetical protein MLGJGCBP_09322 [Rhodococcus sp. T7]KAF0965109.1 hypothetical protein MLGJGCBP_01733 [Rhodococcus sp. T7]QQZ18177.1 MerR family transcriptional regulator [Rhodococcus sp. 21391]UOT08091.1 MerR family DNA-binding transcriptional regulator [Rhodococcus opacus]
MAELLISELSRRSGVPATTLRYYEQVGLLPAARSHSGYRLYDEHAEQRLRFISAAKRLHLPLPEIFELLTVWEDEACRSVKSQLRPALDARITEAANGIDELTRLHTELVAARGRLDSLPDRADRCDPQCTFLLDPVTVQGMDVATADRPIACTLDGDDYRTRIDAWHSLLDGCPREQVDTGVRVTVPAESAAELAALIVAEQHCCAFLDFTLGFDRDTVALTITAPADARALIDDLITPTAP